MYAACLKWASNRLQRCNILSGVSDLYSVTLIRHTAIKSDSVTLMCEPNNS
jgi:hypothetical protein